MMRGRRGRDLGFGDEGSEQDMKDAESGREVLQGQR